MPYSKTANKTKYNKTYWNLCSKVGLKMSYVPRLCKECKTKFTPKNEKHIFCKNKCRQNWWNKKR